MKKIALAFALSSLFQLAQANVIGVNSMISAAGESQLETWLGQGQLTFTNIFSKTANSTAANFHTAADGKGATLTLMSVSINNGQTWETIGGYNPLSWDTSYNYHYSAPNQYAAFIFNLTDGVKRAQTAQYQTYNQLAYGPTFGGGHDIYVNSALNGGYARGHSYGANSIVDQASYSTALTIRSLDVYTLSADAGTAVPEPTSLALAGIGLLALALRRKKAKSA